MNLKQFIDVSQPEFIIGAQCFDQEIMGICLDSRKLKPGEIFVALPSLRRGGFPGHHFIEEARNRGAVAVIGQSADKEYLATYKIGVLGFQNLFSALARASALIYPRQPEVIVAVTGTNGKSSVVHFANQIWTHLRYRAASIGTLGVMAELGEYDQRQSSLTTPDAIALHQLLDQLAEKGVSHLAMEASSHGLHQFRLDGVQLSAAGFTNLSQDHFDYHKTKLAYFEAKKRLFSELLPSAAAAVLNADIGEFEALKEVSTRRHHRIISYGVHGEDITITNHVLTGDAQELTLRVFGTPYQVKFPLIGDFQLYNALCALGLVIGAGGDVRRSVDCLSFFQGVKGRLEYVGKSASGGRVYVDYAHTPEALVAVLSALRKHCQGHLAVVFGCGGDRDCEKRPLMGEVAEKLADRVYITDDNPRTEDPQKIRQSIKEGCPKGVLIDGRKQAIGSAISDLKAKDILVIAGKGHENYQLIGKQSFPFDDVTIARRFLSYAPPIPSSLLRKKV